VKTKYSSLIIIFIFFSNVSNADLQMTQEQNNRAIDLFKETRCLVCQSQTIYDSNSELASDLKLYIQEEIISGKTDYEIKAQLVNNYGEWILMTPSLSKTNIILWFSPFVFLLLGIFFMFKYISKKNN
jgi:cytochrome c-type biogenesis protein CcmH|tara:strand:- start:4527 stop:4910 length:384 start_codon:yes stop_codon:yes gene_type:complete